VCVPVGVDLVSMVVGLAVGDAVFPLQGLWWMRLSGPRCEGQ